MVDISCTSSMDYEEMLNTIGQVKCFEENGVIFLLKSGADTSYFSQSVKQYSACTECSERSLKYASLIGPGGPVFMQNLENATLTLRPCDREIYRCYRNIPMYATNALDFYLVDEKTFPPKGKGRRPGGGLWSHLTITPAKKTPNFLASKARQLIPLMHTVDLRLRKLMTPEFRESMGTITKLLNKIDRPYYWRQVIAWINSILSSHPQGFDELSVVDQWLLRVKAALNGRIDKENPSVNEDYKQSAEVLSLIQCTSIAALIEMMNERSDPSSHVLDNLCAGMKANNVTSVNAGGISWDKKYTDDLDLWCGIVDPGTGNVSKWASYSNKKRRVHASGTWAILDYDANVTPEDSPSECCSVGVGTFRFEVCLYKRRTHDKVIHFSFTVMRNGRPFRVYRLKISESFRQGDRMHVCTAEFPSGTEREPVCMNLRQSKALSSEWDRVFGEVSVCVPTLGTLGKHCMWQNTQESMIVVFSQTMEGLETDCMELSDRTKRRRTVSSRHPSGGVREVLKRAVSLHIDMSEYSPCYIVKHKANGREHGLVICQYVSAGKLPEPVGHPGLVRMSPEWFGGKGSSSIHVEQRMVKVTGVYQISGSFFVSLDACHPGSEEFPVGGGFFPSGLPDTLAHHQNRWTFLTPLLKPLFPLGSEKPCVGTVLHGRINLYVNGVKTEVEV